MFYIYADDQQIYKPLDDQLVVFNPMLTLEIGKAGSFEFDIPPANPYYSNMSQLTTDISVEMDDEEIFHGRVLSNERGFNNVRHIYVEGDLAYLVDSVQKGVKYSGTTHALFNTIIANHNARVEAAKQFTVGTVNIEDRDIVLVGQSDSEDLNTGDIDYEQIALNSIVDEWNNTYDYIQTCLIDYCGGYLRTRRENGTLYIDLLTDFGNKAIQPIALGSNLLDLTEEITAEEVFTVLIPLGDDNLTIEAVNSGSDELVDTDAVARYGRIVKTQVFSNVTSASTLLENAQRFMESNINIPRTITVRAVDLHLLDTTVTPIRIGDKVTITSSVHDVDDILTCSKIEYDLEHPENNSYTFGNLKQSLTQRYREDARINNDTYGNSAASSSSISSASSAASAGKAAASAAGAAATQADKEKEKALNDFYDAWINFDEDQATVSLGALSRQYYDGKEVLLSQCGIDLDGKTGNINIQSLHNVVNEQGEEIAANEAHIDVVQSNLEVAIEQSTARHSELAGVVADNKTEINQRADDMQAQIDLNATHISETQESLTESVAQIKLVTDDHESKIQSNTSYISTVDGVVSEHSTSITQLSNSVESIIEIKADKVTIDAIETSIDNLITGKTTASALRATDIKAGAISIWSEGSGGALPVMTAEHAHTIAATEQSDGTIKISIGKANTADIPQTTTFSIANTQKYKDGVAAVTVKSFEQMSYSSTGDFSVALEDAYVRYSDSNLIGRVRVNLSNNTQKTCVVSMDGTRAYDAGKAAVKATAPTLDTSWSTSSKGYIYQSGANRYQVRVKSNADNGDSCAGYVYVGASDAYDAGAGSVTVSVTDGGVNWNNSYKMYYYAAKASGSNGASASDSWYFNPTDAIEYGKSLASGYTNIYYNITDSQTSSKIKITVVVYGYNGSYYEQVASGTHEYSK